VSGAIRGSALVAAVLVAAAGVAACGAQGAASQRSATVGHVVDGDTLRLRDGAYVRLVQIDAPEAGQECYAAAATRELARLVPRGSRVLLEADPALDRVDRYGRLLRYVVTNATANVNVELVRRGAATPYFYDGDRGRYARRLLAAVAAARREHRGMWGACRVWWSPDRAVTTRSR
jgi:endonuclease YncB( thermonuclease family)